MSIVLGLYQQILLNGEIVVDSSDDQIELQLSGLVREKRNRLRVANLIYQKVFHEQWVTDEFLKLRPYGEAIAAWLASNSDDTSRLLRGQALRNAQNWAIGKRLSDEDYRFLAASQQAEKQEIELKKRLAEEKLSRFLNAKSQLAAKIHKANLIQKKSSSLRRSLRQFIALFSAIVMVSTIEPLRVPLLDGVENSVTDSFFSTRGSIPWDERIVVVGIDEASIEKNGRFPWQRDTYAQLLPSLAKAPVVVFALLFSDATSFDAALSEAMEAHGGVVMSTGIDSQGRVLVPVEELRESAAALGDASNSIGNDGMSRKAKLIVDPKLEPYQQFQIPT